MKLHKLLLALAVIGLLATGCKEEVINPGDNTYNQGAMEPLDTTARFVTIKQAKAIIDSISLDTLSETGRKTATTYAPGRFRMAGTVITNTTNPISVPGANKRNININFEITDGEDTIACYYIKGLNNVPFTSSYQVPRPGSKLGVIVQLEWYVNDKTGSTSYEAANGFIIRYDKFIVPEPVPDCPAPGEGEISVSEAYEIAMQLKSSSGTSAILTDSAYSVIGIVSEITENGLEKGFKNATFNITDNKQYVVGYRIGGLSQPENIKAGDTVVIKGKLQNYSGGLAEMPQGTLIRTSNATMVEDTTKISPDPAGADVPDGCLNVYQARHLCAALADGATSKDEYYVKGWIYKLDAQNADGIANYGNATFYICATQDGSTRTFDFEAYRILGKDKQKFLMTKQVKEGDFVVLRCKLKNYKSTYETGDNAWMYYSNNPDFIAKEDPTKIADDPAGADIPAGTLNVYEARKKCSELKDGSTTSEEYYVKGWVTKFHSQNADGIKNYGNATFYIAASPTDPEAIPFDFEAYRVLGKDKQKFYKEEQIQVGDFVVLRCKLKNYKGTYETGDGAWVYSSTNPKFELKEDPEQITPDPAEAKEYAKDAKNVYEARAICKALDSGKSTTETYKVKGWISKISTTESDVKSYGNATFSMAATNDGETDMFDFVAYRIKYINGAKFTSLDQIKLGDFVVIEGKLKNYNGTYENGDGAKLIYSTNPNVTVTPAQ